MRNQDMLIHYRKIVYKSMSYKSTSVIVNCFIHSLHRYLVKKHRQDQHEVRNCFDFIWILHLFGYRNTERLCKRFDSFLINPTVKVANL